MKNTWSEIEDPRILHNIERTIHLVEANSNEQQCIWEYYVDRYKYIASWEQINPGIMKILGSLDNRDICLSLSWVKINHYVVCFYYPTSEVVDWKVIESFLSYQFPNIPKVDATNFSNCLHHLQRLDKNKEK